jgi:hypothetical protein
MPSKTFKHKINKSKSKNYNNKSIKRSRKLRLKLRKLKGGGNKFPDAFIQGDLSDDEITTIALILLKLCTTLYDKIEITQKEYELINKVNILNELAIPEKKKYYLYKHNSINKKFRFITNSRYKNLNTPKFIYVLSIDSRIKNRLSEFIYQENNHTPRDLIDDGYAYIFNEENEENDDTEDLPFFDENGDNPYNKYL